MYRSCLPIAGVLLTVLCGCTRKPAASGTGDPQAVPVRQPVKRLVTDYVDFTGRTDAVYSVDIRARVTGYLHRMPFREGSEVRGDSRPRVLSAILGFLAAPVGEAPLLVASMLIPDRWEEGDLLFEIDKRPYQAQYEQADKQVKLNEASLQLARTTLDRDRYVARTVQGGVSQQQLDQDQAAVTEAEARVKAFEASAELYKLNLSYTKVTAPIDGQVSRYYLTTGNIVTQDQTLLTTVVSLDPMYAYFDMDDATLLRIRRAVIEGAIKRPSDGVIPVRMALPGEDGFPHEGKINFVNNQLNPTTGSISVRGIFDNPKLAQGVRLMSPGMFVQIRLPIGQPKEQLLVPDKVILSDQGRKYVYVLDSENKVQKRPVITGALQEDSMRVVRGSKPGEGVREGDWVISGALQQVRPGMVVKPDYPKKTTDSDDKTK